MIYDLLLSAIRSSRRCELASQGRQIARRFWLTAPHRDAPPMGLRSGEFRRGTKTEN
jgi:hypothetical protein